MALPSLNRELPHTPAVLALEEVMRRLTERNEVIRNFCSRPGVQEGRKILNIDAQHAADSLTQSTLVGSGLLHASPLVLTDNEDGSLLIVHHVGRKLAGHAGLLHGGVASMLLDEAMGRACFPLLPEQVGVTVRMEINYQAPIPLDSIVLIRAHTEKVEGRKAWTEATIEDPDTGVVYVKATGHFVQPRWAVSMSKVL
ncbi:hypothetical protein M409DRAFT_18103 [Zasmidium cellare ATCC 36951]|uniref:Thioesterase domain-containing protein n=1 Tax=Zasmidium cellare ATCC 36951 TaxID=1080233 RepID=A0A6A6CXN2_ZASCE|nr:uncharacterized protein M409DRAFT_18103 [Zasmidium cellare ATCC 36951]KAF2171871.1 hypothetical protein M409DRAFT_18103 [Zasmidium cellare ATCC 36951]